MSCSFPRQDEDTVQELGHNFLPVPYKEANFVVQTSLAPTIQPPLPLSCGRKEGKERRKEEIERRRLKEEWKVERRSLKGGGKEEMDGRKEEIKEMGKEEMNVRRMRLKERGKGEMDNRKEDVDRGRKERNGM